MEPLETQAPAKRPNLDQVTTTTYQPEPILSRFVNNVKAQKTEKSSDPIRSVHEPMINTDRAQISKIELKVFTAGHPNLLLKEKQEKLNKLKLKLKGDLADDCQNLKDDNTNSLNLKNQKQI